MPYRGREKEKLKAKICKMRGILVLFLSIFVSQNGFCADQILSASLPQVMEIEKIIVETSEYNRDEPMPNMNIKESANVDSNNILLRLNPVKVQLHTNSSTPIIVNAAFQELKHSGGLYNFSSSNLSVLPQSYTINNPYDHVITDVFTPYVNVKPDTVLGRYIGSILFTLGGI